MKAINNKGATSILIIMLMVVLMVFGLTILTATLSNQTLSEKKQDWVKDYYALESEAAIKLSLIDEQIQSIKLEAIANNNIEDRTNLFIKRLNEEFDIYMDHLLYETVSEAQGEYLKYIDMTLQVIIPDEKMTDDEFLSMSNYSVIAYQQTQDLFEYNDIEFGVPFVPGSKEGFDK